MDFYILPSKAFTIFLGMTMNLIVNFQEPMEFSGARANLISITEVNRGKSFLITAKTTNVNTNVIFYNNKTKYMVYLKTDEMRAHDFVNIYEGKKDSSFSLLADNSDFRILAGKASFLVENKTKSPITINGEVVSSREIFSKNIPLFIKINDKETFFDRRFKWKS